MTATDGRLVADLLAGSWRTLPPCLNIAAVDGAALERVFLTLLESGAGSLAWRRVQGLNLRRSPAGRRLRTAYRQLSLEAAEQESQILPIVAFLRSGGIEPILIKGWGSAR